MLGQRKICERCAKLASDEPVKKPAAVHLPAPSIKVKPPAPRQPSWLASETALTTPEDLRSTNTAELVALLKACRAELQRRKDELEQALGEAA
jgi:hypothetical protein